MFSKWVVVSSAKRLQYICVCVCVCVFICMLCLYRRRTPYAHTFVTSSCSFIHPFILTLINLLGIWLRMLPLGQVKAEYTFWKSKLEEYILIHSTHSISLYFSLLLFSFCGTHHSIQVGARCVCVFVYCCICTLVQTICRHTTQSFIYV